MAAEAPSPVDVTEYQFKLHDKLQVFEPGDGLKSDISLLAASSPFGLVFVGSHSKAEIKVIQLHQFVDAKETGQEVLGRVVPLQGAPHNLACSSDGSYLAVNFTQNGTALLAIYEVASFLAAEIRIKNVFQISADSYVQATQILWNPVVATTFALVMSNGAISIYNLKDIAFEFYSIGKQEQAKCACWSPKGKQIVIGFPNGKLGQYKPDLKPARSIMCPPNIHGDPFNTIAIQWLSTYQFAVVYLQQGEDKSPSLYIINAPKSGQPTYINYYDICYSSCGPRTAQVFLTYIQSWNILLMATSNSMEVGVLGTTETGEFPTWKQYVTPDEARIELPLTIDKQETYPIGFVLETGTTHHLVVAEKQIPVMPMIHILSTHGFLVSFNFLNFTSNAPGLCSPPHPIADLSGLAHFQPLSLAPELVSKTNSQRPGQPNSEVSFSIPSGATSTPAPERKTKPAFGEVGNTKNMFEASSQGPTTLFGSAVGPKPAMSSIALFGGQATTITPNPNHLAFGSQALNQKIAVPTFGESTAFGGTIFGQGSAARVAESQITPQSEINKDTPSTVESSKTSGAQNQVKFQPLYTVSSSFSTTQPPASKENIRQSASQNSATDIDAVKELTKAYIQQFEAELRDLSKRSKNIDISIGNVNESKLVVKQLSELEELSSQAVESTDSLATDIQALRNILNECFVMLTETKSKLNMFENPELPELATLSNANQTNRRQIIKLKSFLATNEAQLQIVNQQIDAQWSNYQDLYRKSKTKMKIPSLEGIYQTLLKQKDILARERLKINNIKSRLGVKGMKDNREALKNDMSIESLADSILSMSFSEQVKADRSCLTESKLKTLRSVLQNRQVVDIKPQRPARPGLNSDVVREMRIKMEKENIRDGATTKPEKMEKQRIKTVVTQIIAKPTPTKPTAVHAVLPTFSAPSQQQKIQEMVQTTEIKPTSANAPNTEKLNTKATSQVLKEKAIPSAPTTSEGFSFPTMQKALAKPNLAFGGNSLPKPTAQLPFSAAQTENALPVAFSSSDEKPFSNSSLASSFNSSGNNNKTSSSILLSKALSSDKSALSFPALNSQAEVKEAALVDKPKAATFVLSSETEHKPETAIKDNVGEKAVSFAGANLSLSCGLGTGFTFVTNPHSGNIFGGQTTIAKPTASVFGAQAGSVAATSTQAATPSTAASLFTPSTGFTSLSLGLNQTSSSNTPTSLSATTPSFSFLNKPTSESGIEATSALSSFTFVGKSDSATTASADSSVTTSEIITSTKATTPPSVTPFATTTSGSAISAFSFKPFAKNLTMGVTTSTSLTTSTDSTDSLFGTLNICKPTTPEITASPTPSSGPVFTALAFSSTTSPDFKPAFGAVTAPGPLLSSTFSTVPTTTETNANSSSGTPLNLKVSAISTTSAFSATGPIQNSATATTTYASTITTSSTAVPNFGNATISSPAFGTSIAPSSAFAATTSAAIGTPSSAFGSTAASTFSFSSASVFGNGMPKPDQSVFSGTTATSGAMSTPFGGAGQTTSPFGGSPTSQSTSGGSLFGSTGGTVGFGIQTSNTGSIFGGGSPPQQPGVFGSGTNTTQSLFGGQTQPTQTSGTGFFGQSTFGGDNSQTTGSIFGGGANASPVQSGAFSSTAAFGQSPFQQQQQNSSFGSNSSFGGNFGAGSGFGQPTGFGPSSPGGSFVQGGQPSVAQSGFGSPGFSKPTFGGPATFGGSPSFGTPAPFGASAGFTSPKSSFGAFGQNTGGFSPPTQKNNLFESLGSSDAELSFSNLAQTTNNAANAKQQFGGSSFSTWR